MVWYGREGTIFHARERKERERGNACKTNEAFIRYGF